jgi:K+-transporting ATPase KdpF subunit
MGKGQSLALLKFTEHPAPAYSCSMSIELIIAGILGVFLLVYLVFSIVRPDRF